MVIAGDIGGTKTVLARADSSGDGVKLRAVQRFSGSEFATFADILRSYLTKNDLSEVSKLCVGVAGPVRNGRADMTNLDWRIDAAELARDFSIPHVAVLNDLELSGYGLDKLPGKALHQVNAGQPDDNGNRLLISAGTGLGLTVIPRINGSFYPQPSEGGHSGLSPFNGESERLWQFIRRNRDDVSVEDVLSGPGLCRVFTFLRTERGVELTEEMQEALDKEEGAAITRWAIEEQNTLAIDAVKLFLDVYASESGNVALLGMATAGVYLGGGIIPRFLSLLDRDRFMSCFTQKGKMTDLLNGVPVYVVTDTNLPLYGAAAYFEQAHEKS